MNQCQGHAAQQEADMINEVDLPEFPWVVRPQGDASEFVLLTSNGNRWVIAFRMNGEFMPLKEEAIIRHMVAAANAAEGISITALETVGKSLFDGDIATLEQESRQMRARMERLERENADMVRHLEMARDRMYDLLGRDDGQAWKEARKALPRIEEAIIRAKDTSPAWTGEINPADLRVETYSKRQGGFILHPDNGVRITHTPSGISAECDDERSQHRNRHNAMVQLVEKLGGNDWPHGATIKLRWSGYGPYPEVTGWAKRGPNGELVSAYSKLPLDEAQWTVVEERKEGA